jgi:hypothetical protein
LTPLIGKLHQCSGLNGHPHCSPGVEPVRREHIFSQAVLNSTNSLQTGNTGKSVILKYSLEFFMLINLGKGH